jgi:DNA polymerase III alpha subunit (gram-positive type)
MRKYFLFDTETGGLEAEKVSILSLFGMVLDNKLNIVDSIDLVIKPNDGRYVLDIQAMNVNKINILEHDKIAISEYEAGRRLNNFLFKHVGIWSEKPNRLIPAGHNIGGLDIPMGMRLVGTDNWRRLVSYRLLDTGNIGQFLVLQGILPENNSCSLRDLCEHYKIDYTGAHDAKQDALMTLEVLKAMAKENHTCLTNPIS